MSWLIHRWLTLFGISLLVFKACHSLFLRHTQSGKCIAASTNWFHEDQQASRYWTEMINNCLDDNARFRYVDTEVLHNVRTGGASATLYGSTRYKNRLFIYEGKNGNGRNFEQNSERYLKQTAAGSLSFHTLNKKSCAQPNDISIYVDEKQHCDTPEQNFTFGSVTDYNTKMEDVHCSSTQYMDINRANYGDFNNNGTFDGSASIDTTCSTITNCKVKSLCSGNRSCELTIDNNLLPSHYCSDTSKEIYTEYTCVDNTSNAITSVSIIQLHIVNTGYIQINDGSGWRRVHDENWDKNRQKMLCQYLGFKETADNKIIFSTIGNAKPIATGDFICYNTKASGSSCCIHLQPSTSTASTKIPNVQCKICDKPLLQDDKTFPNSVFSGSGGSNINYRDARITRGGWCTSGSGSEYLLLDLQKQYHITQVAVLADKAQTKWSDSYSLKYSHDTTYKNTEQIKGNQNGYQASITSLNIYNVRYMKIESTGDSNFCIRIQLCGEVQKPAPVYDIKITPSNYSARVTWKIRTAPKDSSYITQIIIYLNNQERKTISRGTQVNIDRLNPYTTYTLGIQTQDGSSQKSQIVNESFKTKEAVPSGPPLNVALIIRGKNALEVSWKAPTKKWNGEQKGYQVCYSDTEKSDSPTCTGPIKPLSYTMSNLQPSTKYFVTVSAATNAGAGPKSAEVSKITNGEPVYPVAISYSSLNVTITKQATYLKEVMVIVQISVNNPAPVENLKTSDLKPYQADKQDPYITAYLKTDALPLTFVIGDGKEYNFKNKNYFNQPLKQNSSYILFLRFFENQNSYYSTEWSNIVKTFVKPPAPNISNIISTSLKMYTISWSIPSLPDQQTVRKYYANYHASNESSKILNISRENTSVTVAVEFDKWYTFKIQIETEAGRSDTTSETWLSHSAPLKSGNKTDDGYTVMLRKPRKEQKIKNVTLVLLKSMSNKPPAPENVELKMSIPSKAQDNVAFRAREFDITEFKGDTIEISLREFKGNRRRKREAAIEVYALASGETYRTAQLNTDESGNRIWSYWSKPFTFIKVPSTPAPPVENSAPEVRIDNSDGGGGGGSAGAAVGASIAVVVIVVAVVLAVIFFRRRRTLKRHEDKEIVSEENCNEMKGVDNEYIEGQNVARPDDPIANENNEGIYSNEADDIEEKEHPPVPVAEFEHYVNELKENDKCEFWKQYDDLPKDMKTSWEVAKKPFNKKKNRYGNIVTYDHCRVVLSGDENEDYINASYIDGIKENSYIASQGPNKLTVSDMWRMVWEQGSYSIVMVTSLIELGKPKCEKYWPDKGTEKYGDIEVTLMKIEEFAYHVTHILQLKKDGEEREVRHYYFQSWPDHGVPKDPTQLLAFRRHYRTHHLEQSGPIVVHCSAGVGRTGVFLAIDTILDKLEKGVINSIDVFGQVCAMRERRMHMVQTLEQYIFVHEAILETILCGMNEVDSCKIQEDIKKLAEEKASGLTGFQEKFKTLGEVSPKLSPDECTAALLEGNYNKNRNKNVYPAEGNRVPLQYVNGVENSDYINAVFVHGYLGRNYFIATQSPLPNTINDFWRLVHAQKSSTIVLLNNVKDGTSFPRFWPTNRGEPTQYDSLTVQLDSETESDGIWTRKFILSPYPDLSDGQVVNIFHYTKWPDHRVPPNADGVISLTSLVENSRKNHGQEPIIVACSDGAGRTGTYIAISNLLERMKIEQAMDVFQSIKIIRGTRPQFVENAEQYQFCYTAIMAYLDAFSEYANFE